MKSFTLVETLITIFIFGLIIGVVFASVARIYKTHTYAWQQSVAIDEASRGVRTMIREIREAKPGDDGSYPIKKAGDKEFIFYSDIDKDGEVERVRYFLATVGSGEQTQECVVFSDGGSCSVTFSDFLEGTMTSAEVKVSVEGDFGWSQEYAEIYADGGYLERVCKNSCSDCAGNWEGDVVFDVTGEAADGVIQFTADATSQVDNFCDWIESNHAMKVKFEFSWEEDLPGLESEFKKGIINPVSPPIRYPLDQEEVSILSFYVRNSPPIFEYFDADGDKITDYPARLADAKLMKVFLIINIDPNRPPQDFELESYVQLRNLKEEY